MAASCKSSLPIFFLLIVAAALFFTTTVAEIRSTEIRSNDRFAIPFDEFGFTHSGRLVLNVSQIYFSNPKTDLSQVGFFFCTRDSWLHVLEQIQERDIGCSLQSDLIKRLVTFDQLKGNDRYDTSFNVSDANQFTLVFGNCVPGLQISMNVHSAMYNVDPKSGRRDYLSAAEDKSYIKRTGTAHGWDVLFYIFSFLKGITLFTLIVLIGTGWSFLKPYLQNKEKKVLMIVIPLQVVANVAQVVLDETGPFGQDSHTWNQVFLLVDVICCCAVLFPIVWSIKNLREAARTDGKAAVNLMKLTLFRQYYVVVICYIYFTRVVVYALETITSYRYQWTSVVAGELATLAFYVFTAYNFRPKVHNPYFALDDDEEEAAAEALKLEDEFEL
ncbi:hypothetical protein F0562_031020 [Nyssa sinensis]|uniref:Intimal thickness related receptor IRP domain-containing protein n=1 Tax=Nyssa sinensis TaxID=561372 RepID=A0A5J5AUJ9_9ASTE|nr:hypothetical protein F0562_031020 [Nyssa sinensis]